MNDRDTSLELLAGIDGTAKWLNKLDRLFEAVQLTALDAAPSGDKRDLLVASLSAFRDEFYGADDGSDVEGGPDVTDAPALTTPDVRAEVQYMMSNLQGLSADASAIVVKYKNLPYEEAAAIAQHIRDLLPQEPIVILSHEEEFSIEQLDEAAMGAYGWVRA